jgi:hypothetical protein
VIEVTHYRSRKSGQQAGQAVNVWVADCSRSNALEQCSDVIRSARQFPPFPETDTKKKKNIILFLFSLCAKVGGNQNLSNLLQPQQPRYRFNNNNIYKTQKTNKNKRKMRSEVFLIWLSFVVCFVSVIAAIPVVPFSFADIHQGQCH